jgi:CRP-like cAMP-binding protein
LNVEYFVYLAFLFALAGYLARDELWLRLLMLAASANYLAYYYTVTDDPLWEAILTSGALALVNLAVIGIVILERTTLAMSRQVASIYRSFEMLTPGQFRRIMRLGDIRTATQTVRLTTEGEQVQKLCFVTNGSVTVTKQGRRTDIGARIFVGEIAYATGRPASATVDVTPGTVWIEWDQEKLRRLARRFPSLGVALVAQFNVDLLDKVASSQPIGRAAE